MTTTTQTLAAWLLARIAEDEAAARLCAEMFPPPWEVADRGWRVRIYSADVPDQGDHAEPGDTKSPCVMEVEPAYNYDDPKWLSERVEMVARHDPARVLTECQAKRRIVELHGANEPFHVDPCDAHDPITCETVACDTLRALASVYADAPGWREEWR